MRTPPGWEATPPGDAALRLLGPALDAGRSRPSIVVRLEPYDPGRPLNALAASRVEALKTGLAEFRLRSWDASAMLAGAPAIGITYTATLGAANAHLKWGQTFAARGDVLFQFTVAAEEGDFDARRQIFAKIADSLLVR